VIIVCQSVQLGCVEIMCTIQCYNAGVGRVTVFLFHA